MKPLGAWPLRAASVASCLAAVASVAVYTKPCSFYVNFVILPSVFCLMASLVFMLASVVVAWVLRYRGALDRSAVKFVLAAIAAPAAAILLIGVMADTISCVAG